MDELKKLKSALDREENGWQAGPGSVRDMLRKKPMSHVARFQRNLLIELVIGCGVVIAVCVLSMHYPFRVFGMYMVLPFVVFVVSFVHYMKKYRHIRQAIRYTDDVKKALVQALAQMEQLAAMYLRLNVILSVILLPATFLFAIHFRYRGDIPDDAWFGDLHLAWKMILPIVFTCVLLLVLYPVIKWYTRKMFGQFACRLKKSLSELE